MFLPGINKRILNAIQKVFFRRKMNKCIESKEDFKALEKSAKSKEQVKEVQMQKKLDKQGFRYSTKNLFENITSAVKETSEDSTDESISTTKAIQEKDEPKL